MCLGNLIKINTVTGISPLATSPTNSLKDKPTIVYDTNALRIIHDQSNHDQCNMIIPFGCIRRVRNLRKPGN